MTTAEGLLRRVHGHTGSGGRGVPVAGSADCNGHPDYLIGGALLTRKDVEIDVRPFGRPNRIRITGRRRIGVVILGAADVDVADIETETLVFGPARAPSVDHPATRSHRGPLPLDVNGDGYRDLLVHFEAGETGLAELDTEACLVGKIGGQTFWSCSPAEIGVVRGGAGH